MTWSFEGKWERDRERKEAVRKSTKIDMNISVQRTSFPWRGSRQINSSPLCVISIGHIGWEMLKAPFSAPLFFPREPFTGSSGDRLCILFCGQIIVGGCISSWKQLNVKLLSAGIILFPSEQYLCFPLEILHFSLDEIPRIDGGDNTTRYPDLCCEQEEWNQYILWYNLNEIFSVTRESLPKLIKGDDFEFTAYLFI